MESLCSNLEDGSGLDFKCSSSMGSRGWGHLSVVVCGVGSHGPCPQCIVPPENQMPFHNYSCPQCTVPQGTRCHSTITAVHCIWPTCTARSSGLLDWLSTLTHLVNASWSTCQRMKIKTLLNVQSSDFHCILALSEMATWEKTWINQYLTPFSEMKRKKNL